MNPVVLLRRNPETAARCTRILGLANDNWAEVQITFGTDSAAMATVELFLTDDQLLDLVSLACEVTAVWSEPKP